MRQHKPRRPTVGWVGGLAPPPPPPRPPPLDGPIPLGGGGGGWGRRAAATCIYIYTHWGRCPGVPHFYTHIWEFLLHGGHPRLVLKGKQRSAVAELVISKFLLHEGAVTELPGEFVSPKYGILGPQELAIGVQALLGIQTHWKVQLRVPCWISLARGV